MSSLKEQAKLAGNKQFLSKSGNDVKAVKKMAIVKERVRTKLVKDLKTNTKSCIKI